MKSYLTHLNLAAIKGDDSPQSNYDSSEGEQWGRYNLPRYMIYIIYIIQIKSTACCMSNLRYSACCCFAGSIDHYKTCLATGQSTKLPSKVNPIKVNWKSSFWIGTRIKFIGTCDWWLEFWDTSGRDSPFNRAQISNRPPKGLKNSVFDSNLEVSVNGDTQNGWFTMESPIEINDLGIPPILGHLQMVN